MGARLHTLAVSRAATPHGPRLDAPLPAGAAGRWCRLSLSLGAEAARRAPWWAKLSLEDAARGQVVREVFLGPMRRGGGARASLVHVPGEARALAILIFGAEADGAVLRMQVLCRGHAAMRLLWQGLAGLPGALRGAPWGVAGRVRAVIGQGPARAGVAPPYAKWIEWFERAAAPAPLAWDCEIVIAPGDEGPARSGAMAASRASAAGQTPRPVPARLIAEAAAWTEGAAGWVVILQAGEVLAPGACAAFARAARLCPWADALTADCDRLDARGVRCDPLFKPGPDTLLPLAAMSALGALAVRRAVLTAHLPVRAGPARGVLLRGAIGRTAHVPGVLCHMPFNSGGSDMGALQPQPVARRSVPTVMALIPSAARSRHVVRCLRRVASATDYAKLTIRLVLAAPALARASVCAQAARLPGVAILRLDVHPFNYARVNNEAARHCDADLLLLMNDDVAPIDASWLAAMVAHMDDPRVGIVGARLLYGNGSVQHEGVIMGLANLCEHAGRLGDAQRGGAYGIGRLDREVCAVTGACLLIRTALWRALGGMDEAYAVALNDVDLCLRAREAGWRVVYCAGATLHHYESLSLGRHYAGARAGLEAVEVARLRARFAGVIGDDPFYSPLASLQPGREWQPAFPPRPHGAAVGAPTSQIAASTIETGCCG